MYHNKNEYFDLLQTTQYSGGYIRWIKFCVNAINETAKRSAQLLIQYEDIVAKDIKQLEDLQLLPKSVWRVYDYLKLFPVTSISHAATQLGSSFNSISNALHLLQFRIWATSILKEYMKKGFALDDDRLKNLGGGNYFDELLARIRDIRSSEKVFWRKVLEIYATSIDYDPKAESSIIFFKQVQNKMHWAAHKHTAAEVIYQRADADKDNMGLTAWAGKEIKRSDVEVAKNYLSEKEIDALNKIVTAYLDIAEVHALNQEPMYMKDWLETIDDYLKMTRRDILTTKGRVTHKQALEKAHGEYDKYRKKQEDILSPVECHFLESIEELQELEEKK